MLKESLSMIGVGFSVVFVGLISLIGIIYLMSFIVRLVRREQKLPSAFTNTDPNPLPQSSGSILPASNRLTGEKRREIVAAVSAALAEHLGTDVSGIRIHSIRRVGGEAEALVSADRRELIAVISAAVAEELGTDVTGIRILSVRKAA